MAYIGRSENCNIFNDNVSKEVVKLEQNYLVLNDGEVGEGVDGGDAGLVVDRGQSEKALFRFNEEIKSWEYGVESDVRSLGKQLKIIKSSTLAVPYTLYLADTSSSEISILLSSDPKPGYEVEIIDLKGTFDLNHVIVLGNGSKIQESTENAYLDIRFANIKFVYVNTEIGWALAPSNPITLSSNDIIYDNLNKNIEDIEADFNKLSISLIQYNENKIISDIFYHSGNKKGIIINSIGNIKQINYYDTDASTLLASQLFVYDSNKMLVGINWS